jgi:hypothetical protein
MQTRPTTRLVTKMARYARKHSRRETAIKFGIVDPEGRPARSAVTLLLNGYEPKLEETRQRWGLPKKFRLPKPRRTINDHLAHDQLLDMPDPLLKYAIEHREDFS